jgi:hypothetical protein
VARCGGSTTITIWWDFQGVTVTPLSGWNQLETGLPTRWYPHLLILFRASNSANVQPMARGYLSFGDIEGQLEVLRVECTRRDRKGRCGVAQAHREVRAQGQFDGVARDAQRRLPEACDLICPDLSKVL